MAMREVADLGKRLAEGAKLFGEIKDEDVAIATTPKDEVWREDKVTLYRYRPVAETKVEYPGPDRLRADRALRHGRPPGGPLARAQPAAARRRPLRRRLGQPDPGRPAATIDDYVDDYLAGPSPRLGAGMASTRSACSASAKAA